MCTVAELSCTCALTGGVLSTPPTPAGEPQGPGLQVRLHPGDPRHAPPGRQGAGGEEDRLREEPQHPALCLRDALHPVGQEAGRGGGAVQEAHRPHQ